MQYNHELVGFYAMMSPDLRCALLDFIRNCYNKLDVRVYNLHTQNGEIVINNNKLQVHIYLENPENLPNLLNLLFKKEQDIFDITALTISYGKHCPCLEVFEHIARYDLKSLTELGFSFSQESIKEATNAFISQAIRIMGKSNCVVKNISIHPESLAMQVTFNNLGTFVIKSERPINADFNV